MQVENPYKAEIVRRKAVIQIAEAERASWTQKFNSYKAIDVAQLKRELTAASNQEVLAQQALDRVEEDVEKMPVLTIAPGWLMSIVPDAIKSLGAASQAASIATARKNFLNDRIKECTTAYQKAKLNRETLEKKLAQVQEMDESIASAAIAAFTRQIDSQQLSELQEQSLAWEDVMTPLFEALNNENELLANLKHTLATAQALDRQLSEAADGSRRKEIHMRCESELGNGVPGKVIGSLLTQIQTTEGRIRKLQSRIDKKIQILGQPIEHIVIDASNTCYKQGAFIGIAHLKALVSRLPYKVSIIFDASTKRKLKLTDSELKEHFPAEVTVHVCAGSSSADETLLMLADESPRIFVISNDRYIDYPEKKVVMQDRLLKHEIFDDKIVIPALNLSVEVKRPDAST